MSERWSQEEVEILKEKYPKNISDIPELVKRGRSRGAITAKAHRLGIDPSWLWTEKETEILTNEYPDKGSRIPKLMDRGRTRSSISDKAHRLGIDYEGDEKDSKGRFVKKHDIDSQKVENLYEQGLSTYEIAEKLNVSHTCIRELMIRNNIPRRNRVPSPEAPEKRFNASEGEIGYLSGMLDGEGCITLGRHRSKYGIYYRPRVEIVNTNRDCLKRCEMISGGMGTIRFREFSDRKNIYSWRVGNMSQIWKLLYTIKNHLIVKKSQANLMVSFIKLRRKSLLYNEDTSEEEECIFSKLKEVNE